MIAMAIACRAIVVMMICLSALLLRMLPLMARGSIASILAAVSALGIALTASMAAPALIPIFTRGITVIILTVSMRICGYEVF
jgi:hypothetical protein